MTEQDVLKIREEFPILSQKINGKPLVYLDNAATSQKPNIVINALNEYYGANNANIHRGIHHLAEKATAAFEETRKAIKLFINAKFTEEIIFTSGTTDAINLVAQSYGRAFLEEGDEILISTMEHHSNIVPWQMLAKEKNLVLKVIPINEAGEIIMKDFDDLLSKKTKFVSVVHVSNSLGTINPVEEIISKAHAIGAKVLLDGAQATCHLSLDMQELNADFYAFSAHKFYGPTGTGVLYGKKDILNAMPPYRGGGEMIKEVSFEKTTYADLPYKFEAGTPNIADVVGMKYAIDFIKSIGKHKIAQHEDKLLKYATEKMLEIDGLKIIGTAAKKIGVVSFTLEGVHPQDVGIILDQQAIAVRTGHHCTQPLMQYYGLPGTTRASFAVYNSFEEIDRLIEGIIRVKKFLA